MSGPTRAAVDRILALDADDRAELLRALSGPQRREYAQRWPLWAHPGQLAPPGDWRVWLIRAGRGFGNPQDKLIDLVQALRGPYRQNGTFVMNSTTLARIRKFKTSDGQFLWSPSLAGGTPATLLGYPVIEAEDMPDIAANSLSVAFGDFRSGYLIAERSETVILRDPYTNKPFVNFYATKRIGGCVSNSEAIKLLRFAAA